MSFLSSATRVAIDIAANLRGCVQIIRHPLWRAIQSSIMYCGTCVVFPEPNRNKTNNGRDNMSRFEVLFQ